jgi:uncharacterized membrane protein
MKLKTLLTTIGIGAGLMYFFDPQQGNRRRTIVRDRANSLVSQVDSSLDVAIEDAKNRARGALAELSARLSDEETPDWVLEERVRTSLGRATHHTRGLQVEASEGRITLSGPALREEAEAIVKTASRTRGVQAVQNNLQLFDNPEDIPSLQGNGRSEQSTNILEQNWSPGQRLLGSVAGGLLAAYGASRGGLLKPLLGGMGLFLTARGLTNMDPRSLLGIGMGHNAIRVHKAININAPVDEVYRYWRNFENFPRFMHHVKDVKVGDGVSHWKVSGPAGTSVEFDTHITRDIPNHLIAWESIPHSQVKQIGFVRFDPNWDESTRLTVQMRYVPPAGALGHAVAQLFGVDPRQAMNEDLMRLKGLLDQNPLTKRPQPMPAD